MLREKMHALIREVNSQVIEREKLVEYIAIALLTNNNLFILGDTGQGKSFAINEFRKRITGARQFERLISKQSDEEQLFGRLDLGSLIPGGVSAQVLEQDETYQKMLQGLSVLKGKIANDASNPTHLKLLPEVVEKIASYKMALSQLHSSQPTIITKGKIPDSEICFLDELFKANDGILNSLLTALNERKYTNEGQVIDIPVISFFAASNEIPNFSDPEESILKPLFDRFSIKVITQYVQDREKRLEMLAQKQSAVSEQKTAFISLDELLQMQSEIKKVIVTPAINELMDDVLCELRRKGIHISDRKYFNFAPLVQAKAWLDNRDEVQPFDLIMLECYLWNSPEEIAEIHQILGKKCINPLKDKIEEIRTLGLETFDSFKADVANSSKTAIVKFRGEIVAVYKQAKALENELSSENDKALYNALMYDLNQMSKQAHGTVGFTAVSLEELAALN